MSETHIGCGLAWMGGGRLLSRQETLPAQFQEASPEGCGHNEAVDAVTQGRIEARPDDFGSSLTRIEGTVTAVARDKEHESNRKRH